MASFDDLGRALRDDAEANAPRASAIDVDAVIRGARARRRPRQWAVGTLSLVAVLGLGGIAVAASNPPVLIAASETAEGDELLLSNESAAGDSGASAAETPGSREGAAGLLLCGVEVPLAAETPSGLALELRVPPASPAGADAIEGVVVLTNSGADIVTVMTRTEALGVLAQSDIVVGNGAVRGDFGLEYLLGPGESRELPVRIPIAACGPSTDQLLAAGDYWGVALLEIAGSTPGTSEIVVTPPVAVRLD